MKKLIVKNLSKRFKKTVIYNFSYQFEDNKIYGIIGKSGKGKTTLLSILANNIKKYRGEVLYNGQVIKKLKNYTFEQVGCVFQNHQLLEDLTALENVLLYYKLKKIKEDRYYYKTKVLFKYFNILHTLHKKVKFLSIGEKQRVACIRALIKEPDILLLDEPTSALDEYSGSLLMDYLQKIKSNKIIIIISHDKKIINQFDEIIDFDNLKPHDIDSKEVSKTLKKETKIKFYGLRSLYKKVFKGKKLFNYISSGILTFGLISICLSFVIKDFINDVTKQSFKDYDTSMYVTLQSKLIEQQIDFQQDFPECIYYSGLEKNFKETCKNNSNITHMDFNYYDIENTLFIFDNYLSEYKENVVLSIPVSAKEYIFEKNNINVYHKRGNFSISIDKVVISQDDNFYLYSNNCSYLLSYFLSYQLTPAYSYYLYSKDMEKDYNVLVSNNKYHNYYFFKSSKDGIIEIYSSKLSRVPLDSFNEFIDNNTFDSYIISDYMHTYIDYYTGLIYLLDEENSMTQIVINDTLETNQINVTSKYINNKSSQISVKIFNQRYYINEIKKDDNVAIVYMNKTTFNNLNNNDLVYCVLIENLNNDEIIISDNLMINKSLLNLTSINAFSYIINFILFFAIIVSLLAVLTTSIVFSINLNSKKKEIQILKNFGLYKEKIFMLFLYDPISNIFTSVISCIFSILLSKIMISILYYNMSAVMLDINVSITMIILVIFLPFVLIIPLVLCKIMQFINKNY